MAIAFDAGQSGGGTATATLSWTHTTGAGANAILVGVNLDDGNNYTMTATCNGTAMTSLGLVCTDGTTTIANFIPYIQLFLATTSVTASAGNAIVVTASHAPQYDMNGGSLSFSGYTQYGTWAHGFNSAANPSLAVTPTTSGYIVAGFCASGNSITGMSAGTSRYTDNYAGNGSGSTGNNMGGTIPSTGSSVTLTWTTASTSNCFLGIEMQGGAVASGGGPIFLPQQLAGMVRRRRKSAQKPQFNLAAPNATINATVLSAAAAFPAPAVAVGAACITQLLGGATGYFADQFGNPRMVWGDAPWALCGNVGRWSSGAWQSDYDTYLTTRAAQGITVIYTKPMGTPQCGCLNNDGRTYDTLYPFQGGSMANPSTGLTSAYWARIDYFLNSALNKGITVFLNAIGYDSDFTTLGPLSGKSTTEFQAYGTALGTRYASQQNIVWMVADDYYGEADSVISSFLTGLRGAGDTHVIAIENFPENTSRLSLDGSNTHCVWGYTNAQFNFVYSYEVIYYGVELAYSADGTLPVIAGDGYFYQGGSTYYAPDDRGFRQDAWHALSSGARGKISGDEGIWEWPSTAPAQTTAWWWANNAKNIRTAVEALPNWHLLKPDTSSALVTAGRGTHATYTTSQYEPAFTDTWVTASMVPDGSLALIYMSHATTITVNTALLISGWTASWMDPVTTAKTSAGSGPTFNSTAKGNNSQGDPDWVLVFQAATANATASPATVAAAAVFPAPAVSGLPVYPLIIRAAAPAPAPDVPVIPSWVISARQVSASIAPATLSATTSFPAPAVSGSATAAPATLTAATAFPAPAESGSATVSATPLTAAAAFPLTGVSPGPATLTAVAAFPSPAVTGGAIASPATLAATVAFPAPAVSGSVTVTAAAFTAAFPAPAVSPGPATLAVISAFPAPAVSGSAIASPAVLAAAATLPAPAVIPGPAVLAATAGFPAPAVSGSANTSPAALAVTSALPAPAVIPGPAVLAAVAAFPAPSASGSANISPATLSATTAFPLTAVSPGPATLSATTAFPAPVVRQDRTVSPPALTATATVPTPSVTTAGNATATPATLAATTAFPAPAVRQDIAVSVTVLSATAAFPAPAASGSAALTAGTQAATAAFPAPVVRQDATAAPAILTAAAGFPAPAVSGSANTSPATLSATAAFPGATAAGNVAIAPAALTTSSAFPPATVSPGPAVLTAAASFPAPAVTGGGNATAIPAVLAATAAFPAPTVRQDATAAPAVLTATAAFPAPAESGSALAAPVTVTVSTAFPAPVVRQDRTVSALVLSLTAGLPPPAVSGGLTAPVLAATAAFPAPSVSAGSNSTAAPAVLAATAAFPAPVTRQDATAAPAALPASAAFPAPAVSGGAGASPYSADSAHATESAFYYILGTGDTAAAAEGATSIRLRSADAAHAAEAPLSAWPAAHDSARAADMAASAWPAGDDVARATEGWKPFRFTLADSATGLEVMHEMGIWTYVPVNVRLLGTFWRITGTDARGNEVVVLEGERITGQVLELAERVSWSRVTTRVTSADSAAATDSVARAPVAVTCWVQPAVLVQVTGTAAPA